MGVFDLFSKRQKRLQGKVPDIYTYEDIPAPLRVQIVHIFRDTLGNEVQYETRDTYTDRYTYPEIRKIYRWFHNTLCREYGVFSLVEYPKDAISDIFQFLLEEKKYEKVLDVIELGFALIDCDTRNYEYLYRQDASKRANDAISELNARFQEHGVGYRYENGKIIRIDSELIHEEVVKPALKLLSDGFYKTANNEFMQAHEHYRHRRYKDCLTWVLKSLESAMKAICDKRKWAYNKEDSAKRLIEICFKNNLIPDFWQSHFSALRATLESGVPTARNLMGGHGNGTSPTTVPQHLAAYCLHMTASTLVFLIEAEKSLG
jgi:hypothetical protein